MPTNFRNCIFLNIYLEEWRKVCIFTTFLKIAKKMHFTKLFTIGLLALLCSNSVTAKPSSRQNRLYQTLDSLLEHQSELIEEKKARIRMITDGAATLNLTPEQAYLNNTRLYDEYKAFQFDSAFYYINKNLEMHVFEHDPIMEAENLVRMSHILAVSGLFDKAEEMIDRIHPEALLNKVFTI